MHVLGLDIGSSSIKAAILDVDSGSIHDVTQLPFPEPLPGRPAGYFEVDADEVVVRCRQLIDGLLNISTPSAIVFCGQHGGCVLVDSAGKRVSPYISWRDLRTAEPCGDGDSQTVHADLSARLDDALRLQIGNDLASGGTVALLNWMKLRRMLPPDVTPLGIAEYALLILGRGEPVIEPTCAIGMVDLATMKQPRSLYDRLGLDAVRWPELRPYRQVAGEMPHAGRRIPMFPVIGDHQCALLGAMLGEHELSINISTGSQVSLLTPTPQPSMRYQTRCFFDGYLLNTVTHLPAGRALQALVDLLTEIPTAAGLSIDDPWKWIMTMVESRQSTDLQTRLTFFPGPLGSRGEFSNISIDNLHVGDLFRASFRNMADNYRHAAKLLDPAGASTSLLFSGGLARKIPILREEIVSRFALRHRCDSGTEETFLGLLRAAQVICGRADSAIPAHRK